MQADIRAVIFDLDGTLAHTADFDTPEAKTGRVPAMLLERCTPGTAPPFDFGVSALPGTLIAAGYRVGIITRASRAYALTLIGLLHLDWQVLRADADPLHDLAGMAHDLGVEIGEVLFVGDEQLDEAAALACGAVYLRAPWADLPTIYSTMRAERALGVRMAVLPQHAAESELFALARLADGPLVNRPKGTQTPDATRLGQSPGVPAWAEALATLMDYPGVPTRGDYQRAFLAGVPTEARGCVMPQDGRIFFPEIVTASERMFGTVFDDLVVATVGRLFPAIHRRRRRLLSSAPRTSFREACVNRRS